MKNNTLLQEDRDKDRWKGKERKLFTVNLLSEGNILASVFISFSSSSFLSFPTDVSDKQVGAKLWENLGGGGISAGAAATFPFPFLSLSFP